jgi:hypothetical protein
MVLGLLVFVALILAYQAYVSTILVRSRDMDTQQKCLQLGVVWLLPLLGAILCHWFYRLHAVHDRPNKLGYGEAQSPQDAENGPIHDHLP